MWPIYILSYTVGGNVNWYNHYGEHSGGSLKNEKELPYDRAVPLLGVYLKKTIIWKYACTPMFIAALFTIVKTWKQPKCPSADEWIKKMWYIETKQYCWAIKQNECHLQQHGWRSLVGCSPWGREESDMTKQLPFHFSLSCTGEGNGNPLQCSCLENPRDGGAW